MHENGIKCSQECFKIYSTVVKINLTGDAPVGKFFSLSISPLHFFNLLADTIIGILFSPISSRDIYHMMWNLPHHMIDIPT